jgi:hypothetical protein
MAFTKNRLVFSLLRPNERKKKERKKRKENKRKINLLGTMSSARHPMNRSMS